LKHFDVTLAPMAQPPPMQTVLLTRFATTPAPAAQVLSEAWKAPGGPGINEQLDEREAPLR
jgi:hypothetical protein